MGVETIIEKIYGFGSIFVAKWDQLKKKKNAFFGGILGPISPHWSPTSGDLYCMTHMQSPPPTPPGEPSLLST